MGFFLKTCAQFCVYSVTFWSYFVKSSLVACSS